MFVFSLSLNVLGTLNTQILDKTHEPVKQNNGIYLVIKTEYITTITEVFDNKRITKFIDNFRFEVYEWL